MKVLVDTSVWVAHFKRHEPALIALLERDQVVMHPMVLAEIACGTPPAPRARTLADLALLQSGRQASLDEIMALIEQRQLYGLGCGLVDMAILAATLITPGTRLWTLDKRLAALAEHAGLAYQ